MNASKRRRNHDGGKHSWRLQLREDESPSRLALAESLSAAIATADPRTVLRNRVKLRRNVLEIGALSLRLSEFRRVLVIGGGKASAGMALGIERILGSWITSGSVNIPAYTKPWPRSSRIRFNPAAHPIPNEEGVRGVKNMLDLVGQPTKEDLVILLISGGGSALMPLPSRGLSISDKQETTNLLLRSGARIDEINAVRKHLSEIKGGRLAEKLYPAMVVSLIISDVVDDELGSVASGPTIPDDTTYSDAYAVLKEHALWGAVPRSVRSHIQNGKEGKLPETPKKGSRVFKRVHNIIVGNDRESCEAAVKVLRRRGYRTLLLSTRIQGEAREVGTVLSSIVSEIRETQNPVRPPAAIVAGGETTVTVHGKGRGGRNQELVLSAALRIKDMPNVLVSSVGTDGVDGRTDAAGAVADGSSIKRGLKKGLNPHRLLRENDSYTFFKKLDDLVITGSTGTNVNDVMIVIVDSDNHKSDTASRSVRR